MSPQAYVNAVANGHVEVVKWLKANGVRCVARVCYHLALRRDFEMLTWARENGFPWEDDLCTELANKGDLEMLRFVKERGCPW